ncbi:MAG: hypothetical protein QNK89_02765 [Lacinutrix sp.]|uniref:hypothetical protein n=1 Tax=Lacinutrix sp. TaxID=1937692 RepID=UPI0030AE599D
MGFIIKIILGLILKYPGAFIRWQIFKEKLFEEYLEDISLNNTISALFLALILCAYSIFIKPYN